MKNRQSSTQDADSTKGREPSAYQIATLAASLIRPQDNLDSRLIKRVTSLAAELWRASESVAQNIHESEERKILMAGYQAKVPQVPEWQDCDTEDQKPIGYDRGLEVLFPRHRKMQRDAIMLGYLMRWAESEKKSNATARNHWRRLKTEGFSPGEFSRLAAFLPAWLAQRSSTANAENAKQRKVKKSLEA